LTSKLWTHPQTRIQNSTRTGNKGRLKLSAREPKDKRSKRKSMANITKRTVRGQSAKMKAKKKKEN